MLAIHVIIRSEEECLCVVFLRDEDLPCFDRWPCADDNGIEARDSREVRRGSGSPVIRPEDQVMCGEWFGKEEFFRWVNGEVIGVEEEEFFEGGEQHGEDFQLVGFDGKSMWSVDEEI